MYIQLLHLHEAWRYVKVSLKVTEQRVEVLIDRYDQRFDSTVA